MTYLICMRLGPSISSVIAKRLGYSGPSYASSTVYIYTCIHAYIHTNMHSYVHMCVTLGANRHHLFLVDDTVKYIDLVNMAFN